MTKIYSHLSPEWINLNIPHTNGAYWYSKELLERVVPNIKTNRDWVLINAEHSCTDRAIVFIHNNAHPERYEWLAPFKDLILVCSTIKTLNTMIEMYPKYHSIFIPLSIDVDYIKQFKAKRKTKKVCYYGRLEKCPEKIMEDETIGKYGDGERDELLKQVAKYKTVYAIGRCALEAKALGCNVVPHEGEYENVDFALLDNIEIIPELQRLLNEIDGVK